VRAEAVFASVLGASLLDWLKKKSAQPGSEVRDTLFGDLPLSQWVSPLAGTVPLEPWTSFGRAKVHFDSGDARSGVAVLKGILETADLESRHYLEVWHFLRELGLNPPQDRAKDVLGVVVEVGVKDGVDLIAAYVDHRARYYNFSGAAIVWERPNASLDTPIDDLLRAGGAVARVIGPWTGARPSAPPRGEARINMLTPSGLYLGQGPQDSLAKDKLGGPVIAFAFQLMQQLIRLSPSGRVTGE
jgi:hypothetical protein